MTLDERMNALLEAWQVTGSDPETVVFDRVGALLAAEPNERGGRPAKVWQLFVAASLGYPTRREYDRFDRDIGLDGVENATRRLASVVDDSESRSIDFLVDGVVVDIHDVNRGARINGVRRVTREVATRWNRNNGAELVSWDSQEKALRRLSSSEKAELAQPVPGAVSDESEKAILLPLSGTLLIAELAQEGWRGERVEAMVWFSGLAVGVIGYDLAPITAASMTTSGKAPYFALHLQAIAMSSRLAAVSETSAVEFRGWRRMLSSIGLPGPDIRVVPLAAGLAEPSAFAVKTFEREHTSAGEPLVLVVGSHEPRKNHLAIVHAAERLWREGLSFSLVFIGGTTRSTRFFRRSVDALKHAQKRTTTIDNASDETLAAAYRAARFTVFPSTHEGFGLPVAESLASGTPVITSEYGSMRSLVEAGGGGLLVDPNSDDALTDAMRTLLLDSGEYDRLVKEARLRPVRDWDNYAEETWSYLVGE